MNAFCADCRTPGEPLCGECRRRRRADAVRGALLTLAGAALCAVAGVLVDRPVEGGLAAALFLLQVLTTGEFGRLVLRRRLTWTAAALLTTLMLGMAAAAVALVTYRYVRSAWPAIGVAVFLWGAALRLLMRDSWGKIARLSFVMGAAFVVWVMLAAGGIAFVGTLIRTGMDRL